MQVKVTDNIHVLNALVPISIENKGLGNIVVGSSVKSHKSNVDLNSKEWRLHFYSINTTVMNAKNYGSNFEPKDNKLRVNVTMHAVSKKGFKNFIKLFKNKHHEHVLSLNSLELTNACLELSYKGNFKIVLSADADKEQLKDLLNRQSKLFSIC